MKRCCWNLFRPRGFCLKRFRSGPAAVGKISDANADSVLERVKGGAREIFLWRVRPADTQKDFDTNGKAPIFASEIRPHLLAAGPFGDVSPYPLCFVLKDVDRVPWSVFRREDFSRCIKKGEQPPDVCSEDRSPAFFGCAERWCRSPVQKGGIGPLPVAGAHGRRRLGLYVFLGKVWSLERQRGFGRLYSYLALPGVVLSGVTRYRLHAVL